MIFMRNTAILLICLALTGCGGTTYVAHPGSINVFDSVTADTLTGMKATIDAARPLITNGTLPASLKTPVNDLIQAYNTAQAGYLAWRTAMQSGTAAQQSTTLTQLQSDLNAATAALAAYIQAGGK